MASSGAELVCLYIRQESSSILPRVWALSIGDTRLLEVGNTFEDRRCSQVSASMQNASVLIYTVDIDAQLFFQDVNLLIDGEGSSPVLS